MKTTATYLLLPVLIMMVGCQVGPDGKFQWNRPGDSSTQGEGGGAGPDLSEATSGESTVDQLTTRIDELNNDLAQARRQFRVTANELDLVKQQLKDANARLANNSGIDLSADTASSSTTLDAVSIEGLVIGRDGNNIRIEVPRSQLFNANTIALSNEGKTILDRVAAAVKQQYPKQQVMIEGHAASGLTPNDDHQQAIQQTTSVYNYLVGMTQLPANQFSLVSRGNNHPRYSTASDQGREANQRIELVVRPDTF